MALRFPKRQFHDLFLAMTAFVLLIHVGSGSASAQADESSKLKLLQMFATEFVAITPEKPPFPAEFEMGRDDGPTNERPRHQVKMNRPFSIARYEVPQNLYEAVMGQNPSRWKGPRNSVEMISWDDANDFCAKVTQLLHAEKLLSAKEVVRLPTEAEWEYCCRAGTKTLYSFGDEARKKDDRGNIASILDEYAWHTGNAAGNDPPVGALKPNPWGLYDMHGYLWEFTADAWSPNYQQAPTDGTASATNENTTSIVIRSGSWKDSYQKLTSSSREKLNRTDKDDAVGFRCVISLPAR